MAGAVTPRPAASGIGLGGSAGAGGSGARSARRLRNFHAGLAVLVVLAGLVAAVAFVVLFRLFWLSAKPSPATGVVTLAVLLLIAALGLLAATGRLHWLAAVGAALLPFLRRSLGLLRFLPFLGRLFAQYRQQRGGQERAQGARPGAGAMTRQQALAVLGLEREPTRQEIIDAHRRLMAKIHPDKGGSTYLAQQLNEAKRVLLQQH